LIWKSSQPYDPAKYCGEWGDPLLSSSRQFARKVIANLWSKLDFVMEYAQQTISGSNIAKRDTKFCVVRPIEDRSIT
jgi:hypothetical protein